MPSLRTRSGAFGAENVRCFRCGNHHVLSARQSSGAFGEKKVVLMPPPDQLGTKLISAFTNLNQLSEACWVQQHLRVDWGARRQLLVSDAFYTLGALADALAGGLVVLGFGAMAKGLALGFAGVAAPRYIAEISPRETRGFNCAMHNLFINVGILVSLAGGLIQGIPAGTPEEPLQGLGVWFWRVLLGSPALLSICQAILLTTHVAHDTPSQCVAEGRIPEARVILYRTYGLPAELEREVLRVVLFLPNPSLWFLIPRVFRFWEALGGGQEGHGQWLMAMTMALALALAMLWLWTCAWPGAGRKKTPVPPCPQLELQLQELEKSSADARSMPDTSLSTAFRDPSFRFAILLGLAMASFQAFCGLQPIMANAFSFFETAGIAKTSVSSVSTVLAAVNIAVAAFSSNLMDRWGRRALLLIGASCQAVSITALMFCTTGGAVHVAAAGLASCFICIFSIAFTFGTSSVTFVYLSEIYPQEIRGSVRVEPDWNRSGLDLDRTGPVKYINNSYKYSSHDIK